MVLSDLLCPISREIFLHPLLCTDGFSYEESFIKKWMGKNKRSPMTGSELDNDGLRENYTLCAYINNYKALTNRLTIKKLPFNDCVKEVALDGELKVKFHKVLDHYYKSTMELNECCKIITQIYNAVPNNFDVAINYCNILRFSTQFDKALEMIKKLKNIRTGTLVPNYMKVRILSESGKRDKSANYLKKILGKYGIEDHLLVDLRFMSYSLLSTGNRDFAFRIITTYLQVVPNDTRALSHHIYMNLLKENYDYVINASNIYLKNNPDDVSIVFHLAKAYARTSKKQRAVELYGQILKFSVDRAVKAKALYESAINRNSTTEFDLMVKELEESHKYDPREEADGYLAILYTDKKMYEKAEEWLDAFGTRVNIMNDNVYMRIKVQIEEHKELYDKAINSYIRLAELDKANCMYYNSRIELILQKMSESNSNAKE